MYTYYIVMTVNVYTYIYLFMYMYRCVCICTRRRIRKLEGIGIGSRYRHMHMYTYAYVHIYTYEYIFMYIYIYIHAHIDTYVRLRPATSVCGSRSPLPATGADLCRRPVQTTVVGEGFCGKRPAPVLQTSSQEGPLVHVTNPMFFGRGSY